MSTVTTVTQHCFLTPSHNAWNVWTAEGNSSLTNPGATHRALESLAFVADQMAKDGWHLNNVFLDQQNSPALVILTRDVVTGE